jgi:hypothetical protein
MKYATSCVLNGKGFANRYERKLGVSLFILSQQYVKEGNLLYDQQ